MRTPRARVIVAAVAAASLVVALVGTAGAGASVAAKSKKISAEKYAKSMCTVYNSVIDDLGTFIEDLDDVGTTETDPAAFQAAVSDLADAFLAKVAKGERKLKRIYPDVDDGKAIAKQFAKNPVEVQDLIQEAVDEFLAADPTSPAFSASVTVFSVTLSTMPNQLTDVTTGIDNQDFIGAVGDERSCQEIFPVTGG